MSAAAKFRERLEMHKKELNRLNKQIEDIRTLRNLGNNQNKWAILTPTNRHRLHVLKLNYNRDPSRFNLNNLQRTRKGHFNLYTALLWAYGYRPKGETNWVEKNGVRVPSRIPRNEARAFVGAAQARLGLPSLRVQPGSSMSFVRRHLDRAGLLKKTVKKHPPWGGDPPRRAAGRGVYVPKSLEEIAWASPRFKIYHKLSNNNFNKISENLKPELVNLYKRLRSTYRYRNINDPNKVRRYPQLAKYALQHYRRLAAARTIQYAGKRWIQRRLSSSS
jgi:predicted RNA-binding protein YlxR (DUF448 family)